MSLPLNSLSDATVTTAAHTTPGPEKREKGDQSIFLPKALRWQTHRQHVHLTGGGGGVSSEEREKLPW
jgi:hypothetical protein